MTVREIKKRQPSGWLWLQVITGPKNRGSFPSDEALLKLFYLAPNNTSKK